MLTVIQVADDQLYDAPRNANTMDDETYQRLVADIRTLGFWVPILARTVRLDAEGKHTDDQGCPMCLEIADGHHRRRAGREAGMAAFPVIDVSSLSDEQIEMLRLAVNRIRGEPDLAIVADVFKDLTEQGFKPAELELTGFSAQQVGDLLDSLSRGEGDDKVMASQDMPDEEDAKPKPFTLEIEFESRAAYQHARRKLRKAAGKGNELWVGLLRVLGEDPGEEKWTQSADDAA